MSENQKNPALMSDEERREEWGVVCSYCGYREAHHPVEYSDYLDKNGVLCEEVRP